VDLTYEFNDFTDKKDKR